MKHIAYTIAEVIDNRLMLHLTAFVVLLASFTIDAIAQEMPNVPKTGISVNTVYLNDLEDHRWTYYSGVDASVDGGNYNTIYKGKIYSPNPRNLKITYKGNGGAVSITESETSFVYYKTLEQGTITGEYPYTVISNPFSKRPNGKGFGGWKIVKGGDYIKEYDNHQTLPLDQAITFVNLPYNTINCISAEIEFEAVWVDLKNIDYLDTAVDNYVYTETNTGGTYETNILVLKCSQTGTITINSPCTIMMVEPDGSADYRKNTNKFTRDVIPMENGYTKMEFVYWVPGIDSIDAKGCNLTIGRGMQMPSTRKKVYGTGKAVNVDQILKIESGSFTTFDHYKVAPTSITKQWVTFGCDYDRAKSDNTQLTFTNAFIVGAGLKFNNTITRTTELCRTYSLSGNFMTSVKLGNAGSGNSYYVSVTGASQKGCRYLEIQGGIWNANIAGGMDANSKDEPTFTFKMKGGQVKGAVYGAAQHASGNGTRTYVITGGIINGWVAGGANGTAFGAGEMNGASYVYIGGNANIDSKGGTTIINRAVGGNVFGAGCGYCDISNSGKVTLGTNVVIADNAYVERGVYGGGSFGYSPVDKTSNIYITGGVVDGKSGGVNAIPTGTTDTSNNPVYEEEYNSNISGGVFGGACQNKGGNVNIYMTGGNVNGGIYGGSNASGTISGNVTMKILGGQVGSITDAGVVKLANIHGGGYGESTIVTKNVDIILGASNQDTNGIEVYGDIYGGSALGQVNCSLISDGNGNITGYQYTANTHTNVTLHKGIINGSLYGGALGQKNGVNGAISDITANVYGPVTVKVYGGSVRKTSIEGSGGVYGANNLYGTPLRSVTVDIYGTDPAPAEGQYALYAVYGGGNKADYIYNDHPKVTVHNQSNSIEYVYGGGNAAAVEATNIIIWGGNSIGNVFGGGNGTVSAANVTNSTNVTVYGGNIGNVYGGSNTAGTIGGNLNVTINSQAETDSNAPNTMLIENVYGGGNQAASKPGDINIVCTGTNGRINNVYGGANQADITGDISLRIYNGNIGNVFGGNNVSGNINGTITVTVEDDPGNDCGDFSIDNVYGGGNLAPYTVSGEDRNYPVVNMTSGLIRYALYGGGLGSSALVTGNPQVKITGGMIGCTESIEGKEVVHGDIFGGGNEAPVAGNTNVIITDGQIKRNVYGGGNQANVSGTTNVVIGK